MNNTQDIGEKIAHLSAQIYVATHQVLTLLRTFDQEQGWAQQGAASCAQWLSWRVGLGPVAAREKVRVAKALGQLPLLDEAFSQGKISYSKVRAVTRVATPENEETLLTYALHGTTAQVERIVRKVRGVIRAQQPQKDKEAYEKRQLSTWIDDDGMLVLKGRLPAEAGAAVLKALEIAENSKETKSNVSAESAPHDPAPSAAQRRADALALMAQSALDHQLRRGTAADRTQIVLHLEQNAQNEMTCCELGSGAHVSAETARRLSCDASVVQLDKNGMPGHKVRTVPVAIRRGLQARDQGCQFPGCSHRRYVEAHHIKHWSRGGPTTLENMVTLCSHHHQRLHEDGFTVKRLENGALEFRSPQGKVICQAPKLGAAVSHQALALVPGPTADRIAVWKGDSVDYDWAVQALLECRSTVA